MYSSYDNILISDNMITYSTAEAGSNAVYSIPCYPSANSGPTITGGLTSGTVGTVKKTYCIEGSSELSFYRGIDFENSGVNCAPTALTNLGQHRIIAPKNGTQFQTFGKCQCIS